MTTSERCKRFGAADYPENLDDVAAFLKVLEDSIEHPARSPRRSASSPAPRT